MTQFNINGSEVGQLNDKGNNYQFSGNNALSEKGDAVLSTGVQNKLELGHSKPNFLSMLWGKVKPLLKLITGTGAG
ncbi:MAG: hypothetical protein B7Z73_08615 [Planctomycetia bacterium 21-64-5]|nr:MAG: hypothetical protein B7Z73_08615 [Planctomycetia bacterium 21-64-5]HQU42191.1 hypothetical protein [Pirellulales bacterium]